MTTLTRENLRPKTCSVIHAIDIYRLISQPCIKSNSGKTQLVLTLTHLVATPMSAAKPNFLMIIRLVCQFSCRNWA